MAKRSKISVAADHEARYNYERLFPLKRPPQSMTEEQFQQISARLRQRLAEVAERTGDLGEDIFVHGSRASGTAAPDADLDIGIRVSSEKFDALIRDRLARVKKGGDRWKTLQRSILQERLHSREAGISGIRKEIERFILKEMGLGFEKGVQLTVIKEQGKFDQGPYIELPK